jgi:autotransporter-associated beta strand protein
MAQDSGYGGLYPLKTNQITVSVKAVDDAPPVFWIGGGIDGNWSTDGNWSHGVPSARNKLTFAGSRGRTNYNDVLLDAGLVAINTGGFFLGGNTLVLHGGLSSIGDNTWAINSTLNGKQSFLNLSRTFTVAGAVNNNGYDLTLLVNSTLNFDGIISGAGGVFKSGTGKSVMSAINNYTGPTVISLGVLALTNSGAISASTTIDVQDRAVLDGSGLNGSFTVPAGQILKGSGTVIGPVTVNGMLAQGSDAASGWLTFSNRLVLAGKTILRITGGGSTRERIRVAGELDYGGSLIVSNQSSQLKFGDTFKLFDATRYSGSFAEVKLPLLGRGLQWDTNQLTMDGTLRVLASSPQILLVTLTSQSLVVRFQTSVGVKYLIESTSSLELPSSWSLVATRTGIGGTITVALPRDKTEMQEFFRIRAVKAF